MKKRKNIKFSDFYCTCCGNKGIPVIRISGKEREAGHLKKLFCLHCQDEKNMVEVSSFPSKYTLNDFLIEFNNNNFTKEGNRILPWKQCIASIKEGDNHE